MEIYEVKVYDDGTKYWYQNDKYHRLGGPAIEFANGDKSWYQNDKRHRLDGPAVEYADGDKYWYTDGKRLTEADFNNRKGIKCTIDGQDIYLSKESIKSLKELK